MDIKMAEAYNKQLGELKAKAETLRSKQGVYQGQLEESCKKLTELIGIPVTPENLEQVYTEYMAKVENTVQAGMEIMRRIEAGQAQGTGSQPNQAMGQQAPMAGQQTPVAVATEVSGMEATVFTPPTPPMSAPAPSVLEPAPAEPMAPAQAPEPVQGPLLWGGGTVTPDGHTWGSPEGQGGRIQI